MQTALRPYATAGVALVGASVIAVSPVAVPDAAQQVSDRAVQLSASVNPIEVFRPIFETALENARTVGAAIAENPAPILTQVLANQITNLAGLPDAIAAQIGVLPDLPSLIGDALGNGIGSLEGIAGVSQTFLENALAVITDGTLEGQIQSALDSINDGDFGTAFGTLAVLPLLPLLGPGLANIELLPPLIEALQQPLTDAANLLPIVAGPLNNAAQALGVFADPLTVLPIGLGTLIALNGVAVAGGDTIDGLVDAVRNGDPEGVVKTLVTQAGAATSAVLNGALDPSFGIVAGIQTIREAIAGAITPAVTVAEVAKAPSAAAKSFTLTAPLKEITAAPEAAAPEAAAPSGEDTSVSSGLSTADTATKTKESKEPSTATTEKGNTVDLKGGNLVTPGSAKSTGGKHRATDGPSFGKELRDAASKTIKNITGLGRAEKTESTKAAGGEGGSSSSGSGSTGGSEGAK